MSCINQLCILLCKSFQFYTLSVSTQRYIRLSIFFLLIVLSLNQTKAMHIWKHFPPPMVNIWEQQHSNVFIFISRFYLISKVFVCKNYWAQPSGRFNRVFTEDSAEEQEWRTKTCRIKLSNSFHEDMHPPINTVGPSLEQVSSGQFSHFF